MTTLNQVDESELLRQYHELAELAGSLAHEIKNPLSVIHMNADLLSEELTESELESLRDPRNWIRPVTALAAGGVATGALILVGFRRRSRFRG